ncbi:hypothetical protein OIU77_002839 [Salix suchowensis]|uniref:Uncharacterized protein n=1 Tax=Salix suchowensis TaxID=1278906 RepID=A0ABQ9AZV4_9ROSI|nr:hypothetical protein OIU77_002839 [Salix suchowensis]
MGTLASALTALQMEFSDDLTYLPGMAPQLANQAKFEQGGMQVLSKEDIETLEQCRAMCKRGECPPLLVVFDSCEGYTVEADDQIKDLTILAEYSETHLKALSSVPTNVEILHALSMALTIILRMVRRSRIVNV